MTESKVRELMEKAKIETNNWFVDGGQFDDLRLIGIIGKGKSYQIGEIYNADIAKFIAAANPKTITALCTAYLEAIELLKEVSEKRELDLKYIPEYLHGEFVNKAKSFLQKLEDRTIQETKGE